jgi:hypothetical protein
MPNLLQNKKSLCGTGDGDIEQLIPLIGFAVDPHIPHIHKHILKG